MVRIGIIGFGNMGTSHATNIAAGKIPGMCIGGICDVKAERLEYAHQLYPEVTLYGDAAAMMDSGNIDAIIIAVPHYLHPEMAIYGFSKKLHVMTEKPAGVYTKQVREMIAAHTDKSLQFGIMFNQRTNPLYREVRRLVKEELGELKRATWTITGWYRSQSYHDSASWRSTWSGEGGGVLINQSPHNLDLLQWIIGMPRRVFGYCQFGRFYTIEVEDQSTSMWEYDNGAIAQFITTTGEAPGTNRLEIAGDYGNIIVDGDTITFYKNTVSERAFNRTNTAGFGTPPCEKIEIVPEGEKLEHVGILRAFVDAIEHGGELVAYGEEGLNQIMLTNAIYMSTWTNGWIDLPFDDDAYYALLQERIATSQPKAVADKTLDVAGSFINDKYASK